MIEPANLIAVGAHPIAASKWAAALSTAAHEFNIRGDLVLAHWISQLSHECSAFSVLEENLNYSPHALLRMWPRRFTLNTANRYGRLPNIGQRANQEMIANIAYGNRYGNGGPETGDGWLYRGRSPTQLTFRDNYATASEALGVDLVAYPERASESEIGARIAAWFWSKSNLSQLAENDDVKAVTLKINGGLNGLTERTELLADAKGSYGLA